MRQMWCNIVMGKIKTYFSIYKITIYSVYYLYIICKQFYVNDLKILDN